MPLFMLTSTHYVTELLAWLNTLINSLRLRRLFGDSLRLKVARDIVADISAVQTKARADAHSAEVNDLEAAKLIRDALADRQITAEEIPVLEQALRHINHSATADHGITEMLA